MVGGGGGECDGDGDSGECSAPEPQRTRHNQVGARTAEERNADALARAGVRRRLSARALLAPARLLCRQAAAAAAATAAATSCSSATATRGRCAAATYREWEKEKRNFSLFFFSFFPLSPLRFRVRKVDTGTSGATRRRFSITLTICISALGSARRTTAHWTKAASIRTPRRRVCALPILAQWSSSLIPTRRRITTTRIRSPTATATVRRTTVLRRLRRRHQRRRAGRNSVQPSWPQCSEADD
jgi:hypothetical protein